MRLLARFPRITAWLMVLALLSVTTFGAVQGLHALKPGAPEHLEHVHGSIVAIRAGQVFAVRVPGHAGILWFGVAHGAHISLAHLRRHLHEQAPTDVFYQEQRQGQLLAWIAD